MDLFGHVGGVKTEKQKIIYLFYSTSDQREEKCLCTIWLHQDFSLLLQRFFHITYTELFPSFCDTCEGVQLHVPLWQRQILHN